MAKKKNAGKKANANSGAQKRTESRSFEPVDESMSSSAVSTSTMPPIANKNKSTTSVSPFPAPSSSSKPTLAPDPQHPHQPSTSYPTDAHLSRTIQQDRITSLKLSTKDLEAEIARLKEILEDKKKVLQEKKKELMGKVPRNEFARRWREVKKKRGGGRGGEK
jgi:hypothetical protein